MKWLARMIGWQLQKVPTFRGTAASVDSGVISYTPSLAWRLGVRLWNWGRRPYFTWLAHALIV